MFCFRILVYLLFVVPHFCEIETRHCISSLRGQEKKKPSLNFKIDKQTINNMLSLKVVKIFFFNVFYLIALFWENSSNTKLLFQILEPTYKNKLFARVGNLCSQNNFLSILSHFKLEKKKENQKLVVLSEDSHFRWLLLFKKLCKEKETLNLFLEWCWNNFLKSMSILIKNLNN